MIPEHCSFVSEGTKCRLPPEFIIEVEDEIDNSKFMIGLTCSDHRAVLENKFHLLQSKFSNEVYLKEMAELFANFTQAKKYKERFAVHVGRSVTLIPVEDIALFSKEEVIYLVNREGKKFITDFRSLDEIQELVNPKAFYRANRQCIVHIPFIESYRSDDTGKLNVKMKNMKIDELVVSKEKATEFRKWFD